VTAGPYFLGIDLGTSSLKCGLFDAAGSCLKAERVPYRTCEWEGGAEQHCEDWWSATTSGIQSTTAGIDTTHIVAIGVGGHAPSPVFLDEDFHQVCPVSPWFDRRVKPYHDRLVEALGGRPENGDERLMTHVAARALWLKTEDHPAYERAVCFLHSGDYLVARLTGLRVLTARRASRVFAAAKLPPQIIPQRECRPGETVGSLLPEIGRKLGLSPATAVVSGGLDSFLGSVGSGIQQPGDACVNTGSSAVVALLTDTDCVGRFEFADCQLLSQPVGPAGRSIGLFAQAAGRIESADKLLTEALATRPSAWGRRLLPELVQQAPADEVAIQATVLEMVRRHSPVEVLHLLIDVLVLRERAALEEIEQRAEPAQRIWLVGGLTRVADFAQLQCDVLGREVQIPEVADSGALGAAVLAAASVGQDSPEKVARRMVRSRQSLAPRAPVADFYESVFNEMRASAGASV
jgi:xylulokinase